MTDCAQYLDYPSGSCRGLYDKYFGSLNSYGDYFHIYGEWFEVTIPEDIKLVKPDGSVIGDEVCVGERFSVQKGVEKGEYWVDGGYMDSPPIYWVEDVKKVFDRLLGYYEKNITLDEICSTEDNAIPDGSPDRFTGTPIYTSPLELPWDNIGTLYSRLSIRGSLICSLKEVEPDDYGQENTSQDEYLVKDGNWYTAAKQGETSLQKDYQINCMYYVQGAKPDSEYLKEWMQYMVTGCTNNESYYIIRMPTVSAGEYNTGNIFSGGVGTDVKDLFKVGSIKVDNKIKIVSVANPKVELSVAGAEAIKYDESNTLRLLVKNTGDVNVSIKSVYSNPEGKLISCDSESLAPSKQAECLLLVTPVQGQGLSVEVSYDYKSCGRSQTGLVTKTLIDSKTFRPVLKEQSYLMGVHGACDNSYYSCYSATEGSLFAGYKCFKTTNGFYAPATERVNLRFDLSSIPKNAEILGAKLFLKASEIGGKQTINLYPVKNIPEAVKCLPGGDICTKPYCGECKPLYDIDGAVASSAEISTAGQYSFDVTSTVKEKLAGDGVISLQIRGEEGLWESQGQSSCTVENDWDKRDVSFDAGGSDGPYTEVVYK